MVWGDRLYLVEGSSVVLLWLAQHSLTWLYEFPVLEISALMLPFFSPSLSFSYTHTHTGSFSEDEWVPLELCFGMPLFSSELNRKVCRKIASHKLCGRDRWLNHFRLAAFCQGKKWHKQKQKNVFCLQVWYLFFYFDFSLQELLYSSRKLSLKVLSFVQSFQVSAFLAFL